MGSLFGRSCLIHTCLCQGLVVQWADMLGAMQEEGKQFEVRWHPFQLNPGASETAALAVLLVLSPIEWR